MITSKDIIASLKSYNDKANTELVERACDFAAEAHSGQKRKSGEPYLIHVLEVAKILTQMKMDTASVVAAILHDTVEDTEITKDDIKKEFGEDISEIVDGVTKLSKLQFSNKEIRQAETYRKMILAMSQDIRVILVKLADRLHNMRTLQYMTEGKQLTVSQETLDIYAPIAGRMGIHWMKEDLENLSLKFSKPEVFKNIESHISGIKKKREKYMTKIQEILLRQIQPYIPNVEIQGRIKKPFSIYLKMQRQQITIEEVHDIIAFRVVVPTIENCYEVLGNIHALWRPIPGRFKDYVAMPKENNYRSIHTTVLAFESERVEFQIRTKDMHEIAEKGIAAHWRYKDDGGLDTRDEEKFRWLRQLVNWHRELKDSLEFVDTVKLDLFNDEIYVFTPKGDVMNFSHGATPVDFAYAIHSDVGNRCTGAKVNGRIVPLNHVLESGDTVEVMTNKSQTPSKDWLDFAVSSKAKTHIRQYIRSQQRKKSIMIGKNLFDKAAIKKGKSLANITKSAEFKNYLKEKGFMNVDDYYSALAYDKASPEDVFVLFEDKDEKEAQTDENVIQKILRKVAPKNKNAILVDQQNDIMVNLAKCCAPVKGDGIMGFVTRGRGITVHRVDCPKVLDMDPDRRVDVAWNTGIEIEQNTRLTIVTEDKKGVLADITKLISEKNVNISKVLVKTTDANMAYIFIDIGVKNVQELIRVMKAVENLKGVIRVERN